MAVRIPVVVTQNVRRSGAMADYEEKLITQLIFENGLDATLVADLKSIGIDTTDHLCIEGLKGDFAIATWESTEYVCEHLHRLGVGSIELVPMDGGPRHVSKQDDQPAKTIFFIALSTATPIDKTIGTLKSLREARSVPVFSIGGLKPSTVSLAAEKSLAIDKTQIGNILPISRSVLPSYANSSQEAQPTSEPTKVVAGSATNSHHDDSFPEIDQLMLDLDRFEL